MPYPEPQIDLGVVSPPVHLYGTAAFTATLNGSTTPSTYDIVFQPVGTDNSGGTFTGLIYNDGQFPVVWWGRRGGLSVDPKYIVPPFDFQPHRIDPERRRYDHLWKRDL